MSQESRVDPGSGDGCARHTTRSTGSWESKSSIVGSGRRGGGRGGKMGDATENPQSRSAPSRGLAIKYSILHLNRSEA